MGVFTLFDVVAVLVFIASISHIEYVDANESCHLYAEGNVYPNGGAKHGVDHTVHYSKAQSKLTCSSC